MSFESMQDVLNTVRTYSEQVESLYQWHASRARTPQVEAVLKRAIAQEEELRSATARYADQAGFRPESAWFKWHDRRQLFAALEGLDDAPMRSLREALTLMERCDSALAAYYSALTASTNGTHALALIEGLREQRLSHTRRRSWQAQRAAAQ